MKSFRTMVPVFGLVALLAGCSAGEKAASGGVDNAVTASAHSALATATAAGEVGGRRHPHGGPDMLVFAALHENIGLTDAQRTTVKSLAEQDRRSAPPPPDKARTAALAAAIRSGNVDRAGLPHRPQVTDAEIQQHIAASATRLATLHKTLSKEQRAALVDALIAEQGQRHDGDKARGDDGPRPHGAAPGHRAGGLGGGFLADLELTQAQKDAIQAKLEAQRPTAPSAANREAMKAKHEAMKKDLDTKLQTFKADTFDATAFVTPPAGAKPPGAEEAHGGPGNELAVIVPILTPAQREKLAQRIEQGQPRH